MRNVKWCAFLSFFIVFLDQFIKKVIVFYIPLHESIEIIPSFFYLTYLQNNGAAFSMLEGKGTFLIFFALLIIGYLFYYIQKNPYFHKLEIISYSLIVGGAIGNLLDRLFLGYVVDYLEFHIFHYVFPIFNLADICVVCGTILLLLLLGRGKNDEFPNFRRR